MVHTDFHTIFSDFSIQIVSQFLVERGVTMNLISNKKNNPNPKFRYNYVVKVFVQRKDDNHESFARMTRDIIPHAFRVPGFERLYRYVQVIRSNRERHFKGRTRFNDVRFFSFFSPS